MCHIDNGIVFLLQCSFLKTVWKRSEGNYIDGLGKFRARELVAGRNGY
jgi:hypothetical protein